MHDILVYPDPPKSKGKQTSDMPKHLSGEQMIEYLEVKRLNKKKEEQEKIKRREDREKKRS